MTFWKLYIAASEKYWYAFLAAAIAPLILFGRSGRLTASNVLDFLLGVTSGLIIFGAALGTMSAINKKKASSPSENAQ